MRFWKQALIAGSVTFASMAFLFWFYGATIECTQFHNTTDWRRLCGVTEEQVGLAWGIAVGLIIFILGALYAAWRLNKVMREMGEIIAKQSEPIKPSDPEASGAMGWTDPDPGDPHEWTKANRDEDPR